MSTGFIFGVILILIGIAAITGFSVFQLVLGILLIFWGVRMLSRHGARSSDWTDRNPPATARESSVNDVFVFSPVSKIFQSDDWKGGKIVIVFAGGHIDLRNVKVRGGSVSLEVVAVFSDAKIIVPKGWRVHSEGTAAFGNYINSTEPSALEVTLHLKGSVVFGQIEIVN